MKTKNIPSRWINIQSSETHKNTNKNSATDTILEEISRDSTASAESIADLKKRIFDHFNPPKTK